MSKNVLVTGASGYIGGQTVLLLADQGYTVIGIDRNQPSDAINSACQSFILDDFVNIPDLNIMRPYGIDAIVHCAGTSLVGPSIEDPREYYNNNFVKTKRLVDYLVQVKLSHVKFIYSSSAAVYGDNASNYYREEDATNPISPYGESKLMTEMMLKSYNRAYDLNYVAFRYFNACGADPQGRHGQAPGATHIIARVLESIRDKKQFTLYGIDYPTGDGSCIRDYVHVEDIARAHMMALDDKIVSGVYNLGCGNPIGRSNRDIIRLAEKITESKLEVMLGDKRPGDPAALIADPYNFNSATDNKWRQYELDDMIRTAWNWYTR